MVIEIDDSGTGDLVGNAFIGFLRKETGELLFRTLPVELFQSDNWTDKMPLKLTLELVRDGLREMNFNKDKELIKICRGNIFDNVRTYFIEEGIDFENSVIEGKLQEAVEGRLITHLRSDLGVKSKNLTKKSGAKRFLVLFNWVCHDFYNREKYVKSGFKKWNSVWRQRAIKKYKKIKETQQN